MSETPKRIFITGFSGTGKSAVAPIVAAMLGWRTVDCDDEIVRTAGKSIARVFAEDGEPRFRQLESEALECLAATEETVVALGGGAVVSAANRRLIGERGFLVCLEASTNTILSRLKGTGARSKTERPLLAGRDRRERIERLKAQRQAIYALADAAVHTDGLSPEEVAGEIVAALKSRGAWVSNSPRRLLLPEERGGGASEAISVSAPGGEYRVHIEWAALDRLGLRMHEAGLKGRAFVVTDSNVLGCHASRTKIVLEDAGFQCDVLAVPAGERSKSLRTVSRIYDWLVSRRCERGDAIVALGGGVIGDMAGLVAATFLRGIPLVQAPTSLLAMVDASVGGKVAVDHKAGKNLIGAFYQPRLVSQDASTLKTLPRRELISGYAEVIKHGLILDEALMAFLEQRADDLLCLEPSATVEMLRRSVALKARVVVEDPLETKGIRTMLNYGHTVAHALETATEYGRLLHGEAVSIGMVAAAEIGVRMGVTPADVAKRQRALLMRFGLPVEIGDVDRKRIERAMALDKKVEGGAVRWVLLRSAGQAVTRTDVDKAAVEKGLDSVLK